MRIQTKGFTLVEVMIVVAIIAVLATLSLPGLLRVRINANEANAEATLKTISNACETYASANEGSYPTSMADLTGATPPFLNEDYTAVTQRGYSFACPILAFDSYSCTATPVSCGNTGSKDFTISTGAILSSVACS